MRVATHATVLGDFSGAAVTFHDVETRFLRSHAGTFHVDTAWSRPSSTPMYVRAGMCLAEYTDLVRAMAEAEAGRASARPGGLSRWLARTMVLRKRQRAFGAEPALRRWLANRTMQFRQTPLPA